MTRKEILEAAQQCVCTDRNDQYGEPEDSFQQVANLWNDYLDFDASIFKLTSYDVAVMMALLKIARIANNPEKADSWIDLAGYAACGGELATREKVGEAND